MCRSKLVLIILALAAPVPIWASSMWCERPRIDPSEWAKEGLRNGDTVFLGKVYSVKELPQAEAQPKDDSAKNSDSSRPDEASSMSELLELIKAGQAMDAIRYDHVVSFEILKSWKDPILPIVRTKVNLSILKDIQGFKVGDIYLVVGRELEGELYWIRNRCIDAINNAFAEKFIEALESSAPSPSG